MPAVSRLIFIAPILPLRSGIAQHSTLLHRALAETGPLLTISFSRQYPVWLFPGASGRDPEYQGYDEPGVEYGIDSLYPWTWRRWLRIGLANKPDAVLIPWWTVFWAPCFWYLARAFRRNGVRVIFLCHNIVDHEEAAWKQRASRWVLQQASAFITHSMVTRMRLLEVVPDGRVTVFPHPIYNQYPAARGKLARRAGTELLFYGFIRPYKGINVLIEAMRLLARDDVHLTIVGEFWKDEEKTKHTIREYGLQDKIDIIPHYVTEQETAEYFDRCDLVVLPYLSASDSGVVSIAYHYNKPVVATRVGGIPESVHEGRTGYLVEPGSPEKLADALRNVPPPALAAMAENIRILKLDRTWDGLARTIRELAYTGRKQ